MPICALFALTLSQHTAPAHPTRLSSLEQLSGWRPIFDGTTFDGWTISRAHTAAPDAKPPEILDGWLVASPSTGISLRISQPYSDCEILCDYRSWNDPALHRDHLRIPIEGLIHPHHPSTKLDYLENPTFEITPWSLQPNQLHSDLWDISLEPGFHRHAVRNVFLRDLHALPGHAVPLFDATSLAHWHPIGDASFTLDASTILAQSTTGKANAFLVSDDTFADFLLTLELKNESPGNSGIQIRSRVVGDDPTTSYATGYQIEIDPSPRAWSGGLYEERGRGWLHNLATDEPARRAFHPGEWNRYRIECVGPHILAYVNDIPTTDVLDPDSLEGILGLQVHSGHDTKIRFANLSLHSFGRHTWRALDAHTFLADGAALSPDFGLRLTRADDSTLTNWTLHFRGHHPDPHTPAPANTDLVSIDEHSASLRLDDERLLHPQAPRPWRELCVLAYAERIAVFRDHERIFESRTATGPDGPHIWLAPPTTPDPTQPFSRIESLEPVR